MSGWREVLLGELLTAQPVTGTRLLDDPQAEGHPFVETKHVSSGQPWLEHPPAPGAVQAKKVRLTQYGDLLLVSRGLDASRPVGCSTILFEEPAAFSQSLLRLRVDRHRVLPDFLRLYLTSRTGRLGLDAQTTGTTITNLPGRAVERVKIFLPTMPEQTAIVEAMRSLERSCIDIARLSGTLEDLRDTTREGLIQQVLAPSSDSGTDS